MGTSLSLQLFSCSLVSLLFVLWSLIKRNFPFTCLLFVYWIHHFIRMNSILHSLHSITNVQETSVFESSCHWKCGQKVETRAPIINHELKVRWPLQFICSYALLVTQNYRLITVWETWIYVAAEIQWKAILRYSKPTPCVVRKKEWEQRRSKVASWCLLWLVKRHILGQSDVEQWKIKLGALSIFTYAWLKASVS